MHVIDVYLDLPLLGSLLGWIQDSALLWMVAQISGVKVNLKRLVLGGAIGGIFQLVLLINQASDGLLYPWILSPPVFLIVIPALMICAVFLPANTQKILRVAGYFYILSFLLSGIHWGFDSLNSRFFHVKMSLFWRFGFHVTWIFLLGELGWGVVHRQLWERLYFYPIQIDWDGQQLKLNALLDTGNRLHDPLSKLPVIIIEFSRIKNFLPKEVVDLTESFITGDIAETTDWELPGRWIERVRILPFNSLGREHGVLFGFRPDQIRIWQRQQQVIIKNAIVALYNRPLSPEDAFQALIPPTVLNN